MRAHVALLAHQPIPVYNGPWAYGSVSQSVIRHAARGQAKAGSPYDAKQMDSVQV